MMHVVCTYYINVGLFVTHVGIVVGKVKAQFYYFLWQPWLPSLWPVSRRSFVVLYLVGALR